MPSSGGSSHPRDWTQVSCIAGKFFTVWATISHDINNMWLEFSDFFLLIFIISCIMSSVIIILWKWLLLKLQMIYFLQISWNFLSPKVPLMLCSSWCFVGFILKLYLHSTSMMLNFLVPLTLPFLGYLLTLSTHHWCSPFLWLLLSLYVFVALYL